MQTAPVVTDMMEESAEGSGSVSLGTSPSLGWRDVKEGLPKEVTPGLRKDEKEEDHSRLRDQRVGSCEAWGMRGAVRLHREGPWGQPDLGERIAQDCDLK